MQQNIQPDTSWKPKMLVVGAALGAVLGAGTAYLMARTSEERGGGPPQISTTEILTLGVSTIGLVRGIAQMGNK